MNGLRTEEPYCHQTAYGLIINELLEAKFYSLFFLGVLKGFSPLYVRLGRIRLFKIIEASFKNGYKSSSVKSDKQKFVMVAIRKK